MKKKWFPFEQYQLAYLFSFMNLNLCSIVPSLGVAQAMIYLFLLAIFSDPCVLTFTNARGYITSPYYPLKYDDNMNCTYLINVVGMSTVTLSFRVFDLECCCDFLNIYSDSLIYPENLVFSRYLICIPSSFRTFRTTNFNILYTSNIFAKYSVQQKFTLESLHITKYLSKVWTLTFKLT